MSTHIPSLGTHWENFYGYMKALSEETRINGVPLSELTDTELRRKLMDRRVSVTSPLKNDLVDSLKKVGRSR